MAMAVPTPSPTSTPMQTPGGSPSASSTDASTAAARAVDIRAYRPIPLTAAQEGQVRDLYYKRVRDKCAEEIRAFAQCSAGRTVTIPIICRQQRLAMNKCMISHATREEEDRAREEWFLRVPERQREHQDKQRWKDRERQKHRDWWGLDEHGNRALQDPSLSPGELKAAEEARPLRPKR